MDDDRLLFDWIRNYVGIVLLFSIAGGVLGLGVARATPTRYEGWSLAVQVGETIPARALGPASLAIFRSAEVYEPAMQELGLTLSPEAFYEEHAELRPVPETNALIVVGRSGDRDEAVRISDVLATSFIHAVEIRGLANLTLFSRASAVELEVSTSLLLVVGAIAGLWLGLAVAVLHYRLRRPVLTLERAVTLLAPASVSMVEGRRRLFRVLRRAPSPKDAADDDGADAAPPGEGEGGPRVIAHAGTGESQIEEARVMASLHPEMASSPVRLLWIR